MAGSTADALLQWDQLHRLHDGSGGAAVRQLAGQAGASLLPAGRGQGRTGEPRSALAVHNRHEATAGLRGTCR